MSKPKRPYIITIGLIVMHASIGWAEPVSKTVPANGFFPLDGAVRRSPEVGRVDTVSGNKRLANPAGKVYALGPRPLGLRPPRVMVGTDNPSLHSVTRNSKAMSPEAARQILSIYAEAE